ncbi:MAG: TIR domain-containing protein [Pseudomonadales bacterium]|nr:TIR domain-containing protein [Pseudomonadales bacterium]
MSEGRIFISYSRHDGAFALQIARDLRASGVEVWIDQLDLVGGPDWRRQVQAVLAKSRRMIVVLSPEAVASRFVRSEWTYVLDSGDADPDLVPVVYRDCDVPFGLHAFQRIFFDDAGQYETAFERLLIALRQDEAQREGNLRALAARARQGTDQLVSAFPARGFNREVGPESLLADAPERAASDVHAPASEAALAPGPDPAPSVPTAAAAPASTGSAAATGAGEGAVTAATAVAQGASLGLPTAVAATVLACAVGGGAWYGMEQGWFASQPSAVSRAGPTNERPPREPSTQPVAERARMSISTRPTDASVVLDGVGRYDRDRRYDFGTYRVLVQASGYESRTLEVQHRGSGTSSYVELEPVAPTEGPMDIRSSPAGARVTVDGAPFSPTRAYAFDRSYELEVSAPGYATQRREIRHGADAGVVSIALSPSSAPRPPTLLDIN